MLKLSINHWNYEVYRERVTAKEWRGILLNGEDKIVVNGHARRIIGKRIGPGVYEIYKEPLNAVPKVRRENMD